jgi:hypothetical protein
LTRESTYTHARVTHTFYLFFFVKRREIRARAKIRDGGVGSHLVVFFVHARAPIIGAFSAPRERNVFGGFSLKP